MRIYKVHYDVWYGDEPDPDDRDWQQVIAGGMKDAVQRVEKYLKKDRGIKKFEILDCCLEVEHLL